MASNFFVKKSQVYSNSALTGTNPVQSNTIDMQVGKSRACLIVNANAGGGSLDATLALLASDDGVNWGNTGIVLPAISGTAAIIPIELPTSFPYLALQITPSSGTGSVIATFSAKGSG